MLDKDFFEFLEYEICKALKNSSNEEIKGFWCDGVLPLESDSNVSQEFINENRKMILKAFIGKDGQTEYELTLKFGENALSRYLKNLDIKECIPNSNKPNWFNIDTKQNRIEVQLD